MSDTYESIFSGDQVDDAIRKASLLNDQTLIVTDNTVNDVSISKHGFMSKLPGTGSVLYTGDGTWRTADDLGVGGDVKGPSSSLSGSIPLFADITGKELKDSGLMISGNNTGDQTITLNGDITGSGTGSIQAVIGVNKVTQSMLSGSIPSSKLIQVDINVVGNLTTGSIGVGFSEINFSGSVTCGQIAPMLDDTYYLGHSGSVFQAYKGVILKDQSGSGKYYKLEIFDGMISTVEFT